MSVFKRRPKKFFGTQRYKISRPQSIETASSKKLAIDPSLSIETKDCSSAQCASEESYRLINTKTLSKGLNDVAVCIVCNSPLTLKEDLVSRRGVVSKVVICCINDKCSKEAIISNPYSEQAKSLNSRVVLGMRSIGRGRAGLETFFGLMDMLPPVAPPSFAEHNCRIAKLSMDMATDNMLAASAHVHCLRNVDEFEILDISVTLDGTWSKRGFTAMHGIVIVIAWDSGQVLDFEILTKRCNVCVRQKGKMEEDSGVHTMVGVSSGIL